MAVGVPRTQPYKGSSRNVRARLRMLGLLGLRRGALAIVGIGIVVLAWWGLALTTDPVRLPTPFAVFDLIRANFTDIPVLYTLTFQRAGIIDGVVYTSVNVIVGAAIGSAAGFALGLLIGRVRVARDLLEGPILIASTVPVLVLVPFMSIWFGTARIAQNGLVIAFALVTVAAVVQQATVNVSATYTQYAASLGASPLRTTWSVIAPAVVPDAIGAIRVAVAAGWSFETVAELLGAQSGAGKAISALSNLSATGDIIAIVVCLGIAAVLIDAVIALTGRWFVRWQG